VRAVGHQKLIARDGEGAKRLLSRGGGVPPAGRQQEQRQEQGAEGKGPA